MVLTATPTGPLYSVSREWVMSRKVARDRPQNIGFSHYWDGTAHRHGLDVGQAVRWRENRPKIRMCRQHIISFQLGLHLLNRNWFTEADPSIICGLVGQLRAAPLSCGTLHDPISIQFRIVWPCTSENARPEVCPRYSRVRAAIFLTPATKGNHLSPKSIRFGPSLGQIPYPAAITCPHSQIP